MEVLHPGPQYRGRFLQTDYPRPYEGKGAAKTALYRRYRERGPTFISVLLLCRKAERIILDLYTGVIVSQLPKGQDWGFIYLKCWGK